MKTKIGLIITFTAILHGAFAQLKNQSKDNSTATSDLVIPISKADLGTFPYFKTFPNFYPTNGSGDSLTLEQNRTYFFDGKKFITVDGKVSKQKLSLRDDKKLKPSEFQLIQEFDKIINALGGKKVYTGKLPKDALKQYAGADEVELGAKGQLVGSAYVGVVEYVVKTPEKEVWLQLNPYNIGSSFYDLLVVERQENLLTTNINKQNELLQNLEKRSKTVFTMDFAPDSAALQTQSKDELLSLVGVLQAHPDWKLKIDVHSAPLTKPEYVLALTQQRAEELKKQLIALGVKSSSVNAQGLGDTKPITSNDTEKGRQTNTRVEVTRL